jgi:hypothetical protein
LAAASLSYNWLMSPQEAFESLALFLEKYDGLEFLCQASMTYLFSPEGQFHSESDDAQIWGRRLEFAAGFYASRSVESSESAPVTGWILEDFKKLIDDYYLAVDLATVNRVRDGSHLGSTVESARIHSMHVRGEAYPHQFDEYALELYREHDAWFERVLGFTISDAQSVADGMISSLNDRFSRLRDTTREQAKELIQSNRTWMNSGLNEKQAMTSAQCQLFYGRAKEHYRFTLENIVECSGLDIERCRSILRRLSQTPPYRNAFFPSTFTDGNTAPWDYNTISERPILSDGENYWLVVPFLFKRNLYYTFYFDLMGDRAYKSEFEKARGRYLEVKVAEYLRRVFPTSAVMLNPDYPNGEEFADVLVLHDGKIVIVQCKGKTLTRPSQVGEDAASIKSDIQKAVKDAVDQGVRCRKYLESNEVANLNLQGTPFTVDMRLVTGIDIVAVTFMPLHMMATRLREVESDLKMPHSDFPAWAVALGDLDVVTDICHSPARFLQYIRRRLLLEEGDIRVHGDEMDLLGFFLSQGLWMKDEQFTDTNLLAIPGFSTEIDEYVFRKWDCREVVEKPSVSRADGFHNLVDGVEGLKQFHRTDCAIALLEVSGSCSTNLMRNLNATKDKTRADSKSHSMSLQGESGETGISFQAFPLGTDDVFRDQRTEGFGIIKKYSEKLDTWVALSWTLGSETVVDRAFWLGFPWEYRDEFEKIAAELRSGRTRL